ncbi:unnamed protein product [Citrullus colocynthis]|uniref:Uncharacterized protein n=1 Tax=Citrullus colocynthis TaxID=252529 RepID=A0ABP0Z8D8_9ROSI
MYNMSCLDLTVIFCETFLLTFGIIVDVTILTGLHPRALMMGILTTNDKVTVLESEKLAWENSPEAQAIREALNPWRNSNAAAETRKDT